MSTMPAKAPVLYPSQTKLLKELGERLLPEGYFLDYGGPTRQFINESSGFLMTFAFALIIMIGVLAVSKFQPAQAVREADEYLTKQAVAQDMREADEFYAELKARLDERAPA